MVYNESMKKLFMSSLLFLVLGCAHHDSMDPNYNSLMHGPAEAATALTIQSEENQTVQSLKLEYTNEKIMSNNYSDGFSALTAQLCKNETTVISFLPSDKNLARWSGIVIRCNKHTYKFNFKNSGDK
jgi:hypothetical protein